MESIMALSIVVFLAGGVIGFFLARYLMLHNKVSKQDFERVNSEKLIVESKLDDEKRNNSVVIAEQKLLIDELRKELQVTSRWRL